jgi:bacterioferritin-associated ferredoxin
MFDCQGRSDCQGCAGRLVCRCLQVTEETIVAAVKTLECRTVQSLRQCTGAGTGCNGCLKALRSYLPCESSPSLSLAEPICSVR